MGALVADVHNLLVYGGIFGYPGSISKPKGMDNVQIFIHTHTYIHIYNNTFCANIPIHTVLRKVLQLYIYIHTYIHTYNTSNAYIHT